MLEIWKNLGFSFIWTSVVYLVIGCVLSTGLFVKRVWNHVNEPHQTKVEITLDSTTSDKVNLVFNGGDVTLKGTHHIRYADHVGATVTPETRKP